MRAAERRRASLSAALAVAIVLLAAPARAACASTAECLTRIEAAQRDLQTLRARFVQIKRLSLLEQPLESTGRFVFKRPDRVRWEMETPERVTLLINGRDLLIPNLPEGERRALAQAPVATALSQLAALFTGDMRALEQSFEIVATDAAAAIHVQLVPRQAAWRQSFRQLDLTFTEPQMTIASLKLDNALGDSVEVRFEDVVRNAEVPDALFATDSGAEGQGQP